MRRLRRSVLCGREELLLVQTLTFFTVKILMHSNLNNMKERKRKKKYHMSPLNFTLLSVVTPEGISVLLCK